MNNKISAINIERFPGKYKINDRFKIIIAKHNNKLTYQYGYQPPLEIIPHNKNTFLVKLLGDKLTFIEGSDGNITKLVLEKPNNKILARKTNK